MQMTEQLAQSATQNEWQLVLTQSTLQMIVIFLLLLVIGLLLWRMYRPLQIPKTIQGVMPVMAAPGHSTTIDEDLYLAPTLIEPVKNRSLRHPSVREEEDTAGLAAAQTQLFDDEATCLLPFDNGPQLFGRLIRVTSEVRFPAELPLRTTSGHLSEETHISIGRHSKQNEVVIRDTSVSRRHAILIQRGEQFYLRDNQSTAGTLINWKRITTDSEAPVQDKDILSFGEAVYEFRLHQDEIDD